MTPSARGTPATGETPAPEVGGGATRGLRWELLVNFAGTGWSALVQIACIPVYLAMLGAERYGLLAFSAVVQLVVKALDLGVSHTINRELAGRRASGRTDGSRELLRTFEVAYAAVGLLVGSALVLAAPVIATRWFGASALGERQVTDAVRLIGLFIAVQWPLTLYQGALLGLGRSTIMNGAAILSSTLAGGGSVLLLLSGHRSITAVLLWQCLVAAAHTLTVAVASHRALPHGARPARVLAQTLRDLRATMTSVGALTLSLLLLTQADKLLASRWLSLAGYGYYMLGATVANGLAVLSAPVFNTFLPRLAALTASDDGPSLAAEYRRGTRLLTVLVFPAMITSCVLAADLLGLWTRDAETARLASAPSTLLLVGMGGASLLQLSTALQMATGRTSLGTCINLLLLLALVPLGAMGSRLGPAGVAGAWASVVATAALAGGALVYRDQLGPGGRRWLFLDIGRTLAAMLAVTLLAWPLLSTSVSQPIAAMRLLTVGLLLTLVAGAVSGFRLSTLTAVRDPARRFR